MLLHLLVCCHDVGNGEDVRVDCVSIQRETVADCVDAHVTGHSTETEDREHLIVVVRFNHHSDVEESALVLVVGPEEMQGVSITRVAVRLGVVDGHSHTNLPARSNVVDKGWLFLDLEVLEYDGCTIASIHGRFATLKVCDCGDSFVDIDSGPVFESKLDASILVIVAELGQSERCLGHAHLRSVKLLRHSPRLDETILPWDLLQDLEVVKGRILAHAHATTGGVADVLPSHGPLCLKIGVFNGLGTNDDLATVAVVAVRQVRGPGLVFGTHEAAHLHFDFTDHVTLPRVVVDVDHLELKLLHLLKEVADGESRLKVRVQVVVDDLGLTNLAPLVVVHLEHFALGVRLAERVKVFELAT